MSAGLGDGKRMRSELSRGGSTGVLVDGAQYQAGDGGCFGGTEVRERVAAPDERVGSREGGNTLQVGEEDAAGVGGVAEAEGATDLIEVYDFGELGGVSINRILL